MAKTIDPWPHVLTEAEVDQCKFVLGKMIARAKRLPGFTVDDRKIEIEWRQKLTRYVEKGGVR